MPWSERRLSTSTETIAAVAAALGIFPKNETLWLEALTHPSFAHEHPELGDSYERLEFFGDALIGAAVAEILYTQRHNSPPGELTFLRSVLVRREHLAAWARTLPLTEAIRFGKGAQSLDEHGKNTALSDVAEALVAVVFIECGHGAVVELLQRTVAKEIPSFTEARVLFEPKNVLQEKLALASIDSPVYVVVDDAEAVVTVEVRWQGGSASGSGRSKRDASVAAARAALEQLAATE